MEDGKPLFRKREPEGSDLPISKKQKNSELFCTPGNCLSRKMVEPYGENELDEINLAALWAKASGGDEHVPRFTEFAIADKNFRGHALSRSMKNLVLAIKHILDEDEAGEIFAPAIYANVKKEAEALLPHLQVLSGGQMRKEGGGKLNAYRAPPVEKPKAEAAAKAVYAWLKSGGSNLRSMLKFLSKGGCFYTAFVNEKLTRAYVAAESVTMDDFTELCVHRLCPPDVGQSCDGAVDWKAMK